MRPWLCWVAASLFVWGCADREKLARGEGCELTSECGAPLVCRLDACREECRVNRDCPLGHACLLDGDGLGGCQLEPELDCVMQSECPQGTVCAHRQCTNECAEARDCPAGAACLNDPERGHACIDMADAACELTSDCADEGLVCAVDGRCRPVCRDGRDCRPEAYCDTAMSPPVCTVMAPDAGIGPDAGMIVDGGP